MEKIVGVILAAGKGKRTSPLDSARLKPLFPVGDKRMIEHQLQAFKELSIKKVFIVVSAGKNPIVDYLKDREQELTLEFIVQEDPQGIADALLKARPYIEDSFLLFLGDIYCRFTDYGILERAIQEGNCSLLLASRENNPKSLMKNYTIKVDDGDNVIRVVEKPEEPETNLKGIGIYYFMQEIFDAILATPRDATTGEYELTSAIQTLIDGGNRVKCLEASGWDMNITYPADVLECNLRWLEDTGRESYTGIDCRIPEGTRIINSVVSDRVIVEKPITIKDSLILADTTIDSEEDVISEIRTREYAIKIPGK